MHDVAGTLGRWSAMVYPAPSSPRGNFVDHVFSKIVHCPYGPNFVICDKVFKYPHPTVKSNAEKKKTFSHIKANAV